ncbi:MAG: MFS transporter [Proteobacteria bacterium]|nr:MFS transporter [Pseudomonadota bacterium]
MNRIWYRIILFWLLGVLAAAQFAKMSIVAPLLRTEWGLSLSELGWLISLLEVGGALFGLIASFALAWTGLRRFLLIGVGMLAAASAVEGLTSDLSILFMARAIEGIGYLLVVIAAPTAIAATADDMTRPRALALWSTFVPVGIAAGGGLTGIMLAMMDASGAMLLWAALLAIAIPVAMRIRFAESPRQRVALPAAAAWISTLGFGLYTIFVSIVTMLLPTFLIEQSGATLGQAALAAALTSLACLPGVALAIRMMRDGDLPNRIMIRTASIALLVTVPLIVMVYRSGADALLTRSAWAMSAVAISGIVPALMFARLPRLANARSSYDPRIATANGLITQFGAGGALIGPPLGGMVVTAWGWPGLGTVCGLLMIAMLVSVVTSEILAGDAGDGKFANS